MYVFPNLLNSRMLLCSVPILRTELNKTGKLVIMVERFTNVLPFSSQFTLYCPASITGTFLLPSGTVLSLVSREHWRDSRERIFTFRFHCTPQDLFWGTEHLVVLITPPQQAEIGEAREAPRAQNLSEWHLKCWALRICPDLVLGITIVLALLILHWIKVASPPQVAS